MASGDNLNAQQPNSLVPDGGWGWVIVFSSFMIHFIMDGITYAMGDIYLEPMLETLKLNRAWISAIFSNLPAVTLFAGPVATVFTNMYGCRIVTIVGACLAALGFFLSRWWDNIIYYYITIGAMGGIGFGLIYAPALISVAYYFEKKRSLAMGIAVSGSGFGTVAFPPLMHWMIKALFGKNYKPALLVEAGIIFACAICGILMRPLPHELSEKRSEKIKARKQAKREAAANVATQDAANSENQQQQKPLLQDHQQQDSTIASASENVNEQEQLNATGARVIPEIESAVSEKDDRNEENEVVAPSTPPVIRKDAFYQGSLENIPMFNENIDEYHKRIIVPRQSTEHHGSVANPHDIKVESFFSELKREVGVKFLLDGAFLLFTISNFMTSIGFNVPYNFAHDLAKDAKVIEEHREKVIMSIGLSNAVGRIIIGFLGDRKKINRLYLYNITLILAGIATMLAPLCGSNVIHHIAYASVFGFFSGGYVGLTSIIITDLVGINNMSSALGVVLLFQGVAVAIGTPMTGLMREIFATYSRPYLWPYFTVGAFIVLSGVILFFIPALKRRQQHRQKLSKVEVAMGVVSYVDENTTSHQRQEKI